MPRLAQVHSRSTAGLDTENGFERQELADETRAVLLQVAPKPCIVNRFGSLVPSSGHFRILIFLPLVICSSYSWLRLLFIVSTVTGAVSEIIHFSVDSSNNNININNCIVSVCIKIPLYLSETLSILLPNSSERIVCKYKT